MMNTGTGSGNNRKARYKTRITNDNQNYFIDIDTFGILFDEGTPLIVIEPGKIYIQ